MSKNNPYTRNKHVGDEDYQGNQASTKVGGAETGDAEYGKSHDQITHELKKQVIFLEAELQKGKEREKELRDKVIQVQIQSQNLKKNKTTKQNNMVEEYKSQINAYEKQITKLGEIVKQKELQAQKLNKAINNKDDTLAAMAKELQSLKDNYKKLMALAHKTTEDYETKIINYHKMFKNFNRQFNTHKSRLAEASTRIGTQAVLTATLDKFNLQLLELTQLNFDCKSLRNSLLVKAGKVDEDYFKTIDAQLSNVRNKTSQYTEQVAKRDSEVTGLRQVMSGVSINLDMRVELLNKFLDQKNGAEIRNTILEVKEMSSFLKKFSQ